MLLFLLLNWFIDFSHGVVQSFQNLDNNFDSLIPVLKLNGTAQ